MIQEERCVLHTLLPGIVGRTLDQVQVLIPVIYLR